MHMRLSRWFAFTVLLFVAISTTACDDDENGLTGPEGLAGTWVLVSANGESLPVVLLEEEGEEGTFTLSILSGSITLASSGTNGGTYDVSLILESTFNGASEQSDEGGTGPYTVSGNTITLDPGGDEPVTVTVSGNQLSASLQDEDLGTVILVFER